MPIEQPFGSKFRACCAASARASAWVALGAIGFWGTAKASDILRGGGGGSSASQPTASTATNVSSSASAALPSAQDRLKATTNALQALQRLQAQARAAAQAAANSSGIPDGLGKGGLQVAAGVPADLLHPKTGEDASLWQGASLPTSSASNVNDITITQTQQQAVLNWETFNIGANTLLTFDQSKGGTDAPSWIAFNKIGVTGSPSQIYGSLRSIGSDGTPATGGQIYLINPNGIIFGGSAQVNTHALVASSLPINDNLITRGLLSDNQFLFSALSQGVGINGSPATTPAAFSDPSFTTNNLVNGGYVLNRVPSDPTKIAVSYRKSDGSVASLSPSTDYTVLQTSDGTTQVVFSNTTLAKLQSSAPVTVSYQLRSDQYGDVAVLPGAQLGDPAKPITGARVALVGPNVGNLGTITTPEGQTILAAGLQVGFAAHATDDPTLRGLDVYVGQVSASDVADTTTSYAGTAGNDAFKTEDGTLYQGLISAPRGNVTITGSAVNQNGFIDSQTSVALNGSVTLAADFNATPNTGYSPQKAGTKFFVYPSADQAPATGMVTFGPESVTRILISDSTTDLTNSTPAIGLPLSSQINVHGQAIDLAAEAADSGTTSAAVIQAPNAAVSLSAGTWFVNNDQNTPLANSGQIYIDRGVTIDVAGTQGATASSSENIVAVQLRGSELADSPLQRDGALRGQTIYVDLRQHSDTWDPTLDGGKGNFTWIGTPLIPEQDIAGYLNLVQRNAGELSVNGGSVNLQAGGSVVLQPGSAIDVSGGWTNYTGANITTTKVISGGNVFDISQANPNLVYTGIYNSITSTTSSKWGVTTSTTHPDLSGGVFDPGYQQGGSGGTIKITAPQMALDGSLAGDTHPGANQTLVIPTTTNKTTVTAGSAQPLPTASELDITFAAQTVIGQTPTNYSPTPPNVVIGDTNSVGTNSPVGDFAIDSTGQYSLDQSRQDEVDLTTALFTQSGFGRFLIDNSDDSEGTNGRTDTSADFGRITLSANSAGVGVPALTLSANSILTLRGANIDILGSIVAPSGSLNFNSLNISPSQTAVANSNQAVVTKANDNRGTTTIADGVTINVAGQALNRLNGDTAAPQAIAGGSVSVSGYNLSIGEGTAVDVSGGAVLNGNGKVTYGNAGKISISGGQEGYLADGSVVLPALWFGANVSGSSPALKGFGASQGGELDVTAPTIQIGGDFAPDGVTAISANLFSRGGFATFGLTGEASLLNPDTAAFNIAEGTVITPTVTNRIVNTQISGTDPLNFEDYTPAANLQSPVSLSFNAKHALTVDTTSGLGRADLVLAETASIALNPNAVNTVSLTGDTVTVLGKVAAPGGSINVASNAASSVSVFGDTTSARATVYLGPTSVLNAAGAFVATPNAQGYQTGNVLTGGKIAVTGNIVAEKNATLDVSGTSATVDIPPTQTAANVASNTSTNGQTRVQQTIASDGGTIILTGKEELFTDATLLGQAGGSSAVGGTLNVASGIFDPNANNPVDVASLQITQKTTTIPVPFFSNGSTAIGQVVTDKNGTALGYVDAPSGQNYFGGYFAVNAFSIGGFDTLALPGRIQFSGAVTISAKNRISIADVSGSTGGLLFADPAAAAKSSLTLNAPYIALGAVLDAPGQQFGFTSPLSPVYNAASLKVNATKLIDLGSISLQNIGSATINASNGDIRGDGTLDIAGSVKLSAGQIYPITATVFNVAAYDYTLNGKTVPGSITIAQVGNAGQFPLSAGGQINLFASNIVQGGTLRAPIGSINLGAGTDGNAPQIDPLSNGAFAATDTLTLTKTSTTSVSAVDPATGTAMVIPYGVNVGGTAWYDPTLTEITSGDASGRTAKSVTLSAASVDDQAGSKVDISGGGDLYAYRFVPGSGGSYDVLGADTANTFAIIPSYSASFAPTSPNVTSVTISTDPGYVSSHLAVGDQVALGASAGLPAGSYTLLPARYALLPGAFLVTDLGIPSAGTAALADGSSVVAGYRYNSNNTSRTLSPVYDSWQVSPAKVTRALAEYDDSYANSFFVQSAATANLAAPRIPLDAGHLVFDANESLSLKGNVASTPAKNADGTAAGHGGIVDINSPLDVLITGPNTVVSTDDAKDKLVLDSAQLDAFGAESLLIGGLRRQTTTGTTVDVSANTIEVDNGPLMDSHGNVVKAGTSLSGSDLILVANQSLAVDAGAMVTQQGTLSSAADAITINGHQQLQPGSSTNFTKSGARVIFPTGTGSGSLTSSVDVTVTNGTSTQKFLAGSLITVASGGTVTLSAPGHLDVAASTADNPTSAIPITLGDGVLLRVSSDAAATVARSVIAGSDLPSINIGSGAILNGGSGSLTIDSTASTQLDSSATLSAHTVNIGSGLISIAFGDTDAKPAGLVFTDAALNALQKASVLSFSSYSSIDFYGSGTLGTATLAQLSLHGPSLRSAAANTDVTLTASNISLDNSTGSVATATANSLDGALTLNGTQSVTLGSATSTGTILLDGFKTAQVKAGSSGTKTTSTTASGLELVGSGGITTAGELTIDASSISGAAQTDQQIIAGGSLNLVNDLGSANDAMTALGAKLALTGSTVKIGENTLLNFPTGSVTVEATTGDLTVSGAINTGGTTQTFEDVSRYTGGGQISLLADAGNITVDKTASLSVAASTDSTSKSTVSAGLLEIAAPRGTFTVTDGTLNGASYNGGAGGQFVADVSQLAAVSSGSAGASLALIDAALNDGGFTQLRSYRVRQGDVAVDGNATAHNYAVSADQGSVDVTGQIDASGPTGGAIAFNAAGSVRVEDKAVLNVSGKNYDDAGKGGTIALSAGANQATPATVDRASSGRFDDSVPVVDVKSGSTLDFTIGLPTLAVAAGSTVTLGSGTRTGEQVAVSVDGTVKATTGGTITIGGVTTSFNAGVAIPFSAGSTISFSGSGTIATQAGGGVGELTLVGDGRGGSIPITTTDGSIVRLTPTDPAALALAYVADANLGNATGTLQIRAPQTAAQYDSSQALVKAPGVQVDPIEGSLKNASSVTVEGYRTFTTIGGYIDSVESDVDQNGQLFASAGNTATLSALLQGGNTDWTRTPLHIRPGAEIVNTIDTSGPSTITLAASGTTSTVQVPANAEIGFPDLSAILATNDLIKFSVPVTLNAADTGNYLYISTLNASSPTASSLSVNGQSSVAFTRSVSASALQSTVDVTVTLTDGTAQTYAANSPLPFLPAGAVINFTGSGSLSALVGSVSANITQGFNAGAVNIPANATVTMPLKGGTVVFSKLGTATYSGGSNVLPVQLIGNASYVSGAGLSTLTPNGGTNLSLTTTRSYVTVASQGVFALPAGVASAGIQISPTDTSATETDVSFKAVSGASISASGGGTISTQHGGVIAQSGLSLDSTGIDLGTTGSSVTFSDGATIVASSAGKVLYTDGTPTQSFAAGDTVPVTSAAKVVFGTSNVPVHLATNDGSVLTVGTAINFGAGMTTFASGALVQLSANSDQVSVRAFGPLVVSNAGALIVTALQDSKISPEATSTSGILVGLQNGSSYAFSGATVLNGTNRGDLTLASTWDLSSFRYGSGNEPGTLTVRTPGNLVINAGASLSDGFGPSPATSVGGLWQAPLLAPGSQSWSYNLIAGADLSAANIRQVLPLSQLDASTGSILLGLNSPALNTSVSASRLTAVLQNYQTIRTGTGDINLSAGRDLQILNDLATVYTAGTAVANPDHLDAALSGAADFDLPNTYYSTGAVNTPLNTPQYSFGGGNVSIVVQNNIEHLNGFNGTPTSSKELPDNWLYRSGSINSDGTFATLSIPASDPNATSNVTSIASTSWWVDFSNFFEGVGALGGGNVTLSAGKNIQNVDAVIPTNARTTKFLNNGADQLASNQHVYELGGGDLQVTAGNNIDGGVYYVERGQGEINAGGSIVTNATRATLSPTQSSALRGSTPDATTWLPTTFYLGDGALSIAANDDVLIGSVVNPFLLPQGVNNSLYLRTFFSTYASTDSVSVSALTGDVTLANVLTPTSQITSGAYGSIGSFIQNTDIGYGSTQPWLRLIETSLSGFNTVAALLPPTLRTTAFSGNIKLVGDLTLSPSAQGTIDLIAAKSIEGFQPNNPINAAAMVSDTNPLVWNSAQINLSDADPDAIPGIFSPTSVSTSANLFPQNAARTALLSVNSLFAESGATLGTNVILQTKEALHGKAAETANGTNAIHNQDDQPAHFYATGGDISGVTLFSAKAADVVAGEDITDIDLYIQNARNDSVSVVSAGRDIIAYDTNSALRQLASQSGGTFNVDLASSGDIQVSGPGTLEILAGRNLALGPILQNIDGTGAGITSIGNLRNANLPFQGANLLIAAGLGVANTQLSTTGGSLNFVDSSGATHPDGFIDQFLNPDSGADVAQRHLPELGQMLGFTIDQKNPAAQNAAIWAAFEKLSPSEQARYALSMFYVVLRDAGRDHNDSTTAGYGNYNEGYEAIASLFISRLDFTDTNAKGFVDTFIDPSNKAGESVVYLPKLAALMKSTDTSAEKIWADYEALSSADQHRLATALFDEVLTEAAQQAGSKDTSTQGKALLAQAVTSLFGNQTWKGDITMTSRNIRTTNGGDISIFAPGGGIALGNTLPPTPVNSTSKTGLPPPGIVTDSGGNINIFTNQNVDVGVARIFTLRGGNEIIWSSEGNIAAGKSSKTVQTAPPTQVLIDPQSGNVETDLSGLATGGGIGVLAAIAGVAPGNVDLIAPVGTVDAGDAGIRSTGNLNIAAAVVLNATNIQVGGVSSGTPAAPAAPNLAPLTAAASNAASASSAAEELTKQSGASAQTETVVPSIVEVDVIGYGGDDTDDGS